MSARKETDSGSPSGRMFYLGCACPARSRERALEREQQDDGARRSKKGLVHCPFPPPSCRGEGKEREVGGPSASVMSLSQ